MIYVKGKLLLGPAHHTTRDDNLVTMLANRDLVKLSNDFSIKQVQSITSAGDGSSSSSSSSTAQFRRGVYIMQKEFAFVDPSKVDFVGTDTAVSSIGVIIRNRRTGMITIAHIDHFASVEQGFVQMIDSLSDDYRTDDKMDVYLIGAVDYPDVDSTYDLCCMVIETLKNRRENFHMQLFQILNNNTRSYSGYAKTIFHGFKMETLNGAVVPAKFDASSRVPDEALRRIRNIAFKKVDQNSNLNKVYHDEDDTFVIDSFNWPEELLEGMTLLVSYEAPKDMMVNAMSKTPKAEPLDYEDYMMRAYDFMVDNHPGDEKVFPGGKARVYKRCANGNWLME